jgi:hypothetical protein
MSPTTPLVAANVARSVPNGSVAAPTDYTIVAGDVSNGLSIPASLFAGAISGSQYGQAGALPERMKIVVKTTTAGTAFSIVVKATASRTDIPGEPPSFPQANAGDITVNVNTVGVYYLGAFTSGRVMQPDMSLLLNFTGTLGVTTIALIIDPYTPAGPRG